MRVADWAGTRLASAATPTRNPVTAVSVARSVGVTSYSNATSSRCAACADGELHRHVGEERLAEWVVDAGARVPQVAVARVRDDTDHGGRPLVVLPHP